MNKLISKDNLTISRKNQRTKTGLYLMLHEKRAVLLDLGDAGAVLYDYFATTLLSTAEQIEDDYIADQLGWTPRKVANTRRLLIKRGYLTFDSSARRSDGEIIKQVYVGKQYSLLINQGLPRNILNHAAFKQLLKKFPIDNPTLSQEQREEMAQDMNEYYKENSHEFK